MIGQTISHYRVTAKIGEGGMGEVYRATDSKLGRDVALKVIPQEFAQDVQRMQRFQREAQVLASLNHPNIATIHGLEDGGGVRALVMELVEGPTLAEHIAAGPMPLDEALQFAKQIAEALEYAHERGIIHRDLKPANVKITADGKVKVLDFGLAKALSDDASAQDASHSPTLSMAATKAGLILGTAAYMSPEQARGRPADKRADVWSFGVVLYEMLTGKQAYTGETASDILAKVLEREPDWTKLPATIPAPIIRILRRCLTKDVRQRLHDIADARIEIEALGREPAAEIAQAIQPARGSARAHWWFALAGLAAGAFLGAVAMRWAQPPARSNPETRPPLLQTAIEAPANAPLALGSYATSMGYDSPVVALSPDGAYLTYLAKAASGTMLYLREMTSGEVRPIPGTEGAINSFFSPDSQWLGFLTNDRVKKIPLRGGAPITLCEARTPVLGWWPNGNFIYFTEDETSRISRVSAEGGKPEGFLDRSKVGVKSFSDVLPDGKSVLAVSLGGIGGDHLDILLVNPGTLETKLLVRSGYGARYVPPGYLVFARAGNLMAVPFDADRKEVTGDPVPVAAGAAMESLFIQVHASYSHNGLMAYVPGGDLSIGKLAWVDRKGTVEYLETPLRLYGALALAPDGKRLAIHVADVKDYVWIYDFGRREGRRLPGSDHNGWPLWSPDGSRIAVHTPALGKQPPILVVRDAEGGGETGLTVNLPGGAASARSWSPTSDVLAVASFDTTWHLGFLALGKTVVSPGFEGIFPTFSPDGRWLAYASSQKTGTYEIFIRSYPDGKVDRQISVDGGIEPLWKPSGELFYRNGNRWFSTRVPTEPDLHWDPPRLVFQTEIIDTPGMSYDVSPDGQRLLVVKRAEPTIQSKINIVVNWAEAMRHVR